jgi:hypothetical protein
LDEVERSGGGRGASEEIILWFPLIFVPALFPLFPLFPRRRKMIGPFNSAGMVTSPKTEFKSVAGSEVDRDISGMKSSLSSSPGFFKLTP